jgi:hypothetical protein
MTDKPISKFPLSIKPTAYSPTVYQTRPDSSLTTMTLYRDSGCPGGLYYYMPRQLPILWDNYWIFHASLFEA